MQVWLIALLATAVSANLCDKCKCIPPDKPTTVQCNCLERKLQNLLVEKKDLESLNQVNKFEVKSCPLIVIKSNAFTDVHQLHTISVQKSREVTLDSDIFSILSFLLVDDVEHLELKEKFLQEVKNVTNIVIKNTHIPKLHQRTLYDIPDLIELQLENVTIDEVDRKAIRLHMGSASQVTIDGCKINHIAEEGILLTSVNDFKITNSKLTSVDKGGLNVTSHVSVNFIRNHFDRKVEPDSLYITSASLNMTGNEFSYIPVHLKVISPNKLSFSKNKILQPNWIEVEMQPEFINGSKDNFFPCKCEHSSGILKENTPIFSHWLENNYCSVLCNISLKRFAGKCSTISNNDDRICENEPSIGQVTPVNAVPLPHTGPFDLTTVPSSEAQPTSKPQVSGSAKFGSSQASLLVMFSIVWTFIKV